MQSGWFARVFFAIVAALAVGGIVGGTACTRWGQPGPVTPTIAPLTSLYVDAKTGSDSSGNGSISKPYKTLTKAVNVLNAAKVVAPNGVTIFLAAGDYDAANGEVFPILLSKSVSISGTNFGFGPTAGSFIDGSGEDTIFERIVHAPPHSAYTTLQAVPPASIALGTLYVGVSKVSLPHNAFYASVDDIGTMSGTTAGFGAFISPRSQNVNGVLVAGGSFACNSCQIRGRGFGIEALTVPVPSSSPGSGPSVTLMRPAGAGDSTISANVVDIITDGSVAVSASGETFERSAYAYTDALTAVVPVATRGAVDFGGGTAGSSGGNNFIGARTTEIFVTRRAVTVSALADTWNPNQQRANRSGQYPHKIIFMPGATGKNVTIRADASGSTVTVGPAPIPTPTPSTSPSASPTSSPT